MSNEKSQQGSFSVFKSGFRKNSNNNNNSVSSNQNFNEVICFGDDSNLFNDFKEIVYNSRIRNTLNLPVEVLTNDSQRTRLAARNKRPGAKKRIPRPQNAFMIYRRDKFASRDFTGVKSSIASVRIAEMWKTESNEVQGYFTALSMLALENHSRKYEGYQYQPRSKKSINRQKAKQPEILPEMLSSPITVYRAQLSVTPPSPVNEYPTPTTNDYLLTPPPPSQHSPITIQSQINGYLTPASSVEYSPVSDGESELDIEQFFPSLQDITPNILNVDSEGNPDEDLSNLFPGAESFFANVFEPQPEPILDENFFSGAEPHFTTDEIQPTLDVNFFSGAEPLFTTDEIQPTLDENLSNLLGTESHSIIPEIQPDFDFNFNFSFVQPACELQIDAPLEETNLATNVDTLSLDPSEWQINNDTTLQPDQMDYYVHGYDTVNGWPSL